MNLLTLRIQSEHDVVASRQRARQVASLLGFSPQEQTRVATAVSEIARNTYAYASGGTMEVGVDGPTGEQNLLFTFSDKGPGIAHLDEVLGGSYRSATGMGLGIVGSRRIMDHFEIRSVPGEGTRVVLGKRLPRGASVATAADYARVSEALARHAPRDAFEEVREQNHELLVALEELQARQQELLELNHELEDTNRGVVALYAELDDRVEQLRRSNALRAQFTSYLSHEFRTPLDSMLALSALLLNRVDGDLTEEQEKQVQYIRRSARDLLNMVDDLLDTARVEAGQVKIRADSFSVSELFSALRATLRPLLTGDSVILAFLDASGLPQMETDEAKVSQILRNLVSNALKFTERGEIRVSAWHDPAADTITFQVSDTGIGIPSDDHGKIFEDFGQVDGAVQRRVKGTGLGLPLSRKLARILGGDISVESAPGAGSTFTVVIPRAYRESLETAAAGGGGA